MRKATYITISTIILVVLIGRYFYNKTMILETYQSPDGHYEIIIKNDRDLFTSTMPGDGGIGSLSVEVILKNTNGKIIGTSNSNAKCSIFYDSLEIVWDIENNQVWYGKAKIMNLITGEVEC